MTYADMLTYADVCLTERTPGVVKVRKELLTLESEAARAKGLWQELATERDKATASILKKARMLTYADVRCGMLTYAVVC
jgi:hypothetical protein